MFLTKSAEKKI